MIESPASLNDLAVQLASDGCHDEAIACLQKALLVEPHNPVLWYNLALSYRVLGRQDDARASLINAVREAPEDIDALNTLGVVSHELGDDAGAAECYRTALELEPGNGTVWNNYGVLFFGQSRFDEARSSFEKALSLIPELDDALYNLRDTYEELGMTDEMDKCDAMLKQRNVE
ncbi:MAG: tetratricopeptide repeat protein [Treponema sp.]|jgi:superkiller protein 3|nr:MAG: tetratricopeptide repeat protein [Treponema sp.]